MLVCWLSAMGKKFICLERLISLECVTFLFVSVYTKRASISAGKSRLSGGCPLLVAFGPFATAACTGNVPLTAHIIFASVSLFIRLNSPLGFMFGPDHHCDDRCEAPCVEFRIRMHIQRLSLGHFCDVCHSLMRSDLCTQIV